MPDLSGMPCWFLGANAPKGYFSRFDQLFSSSPEGRCFLLKGGPGTGKSTVLKKIAAVLKEKDPRTELIFCSADTDSLDAVITSDGAVSAADATLPHAVEPKYPGTYETVINLSDCWNEKVLREHAKEIFMKKREDIFPQRQIFLKRLLRSEWNRFIRKKRKKRLCGFA